MTQHDDERRWPYLSPARPGWRWVRGVRGRLRRAVTGEPAGSPATDPVLVVLDTLEELERLLHAIEKDIQLLVTEAYFRGVSWREIAGRLNRSKQTVHQRYQARVHAPRTHEILRADLIDVHRQAQDLLHRRPGLADPAALAEAAAFLRQMAGPGRAVTDRPVGARVRTPAGEPYGPAAIGPTAART